MTAAEGETDRVTAELAIEQLLDQTWQQRQYRHLLFDTAASMGFIGVLYFLLMPLLAGPIAAAATPPLSVLCALIGLRYAGRARDRGMTEGSHATVHAAYAVQCALWGMAAAGCLGTVGTTVRMHAPGWMGTAQPVASSFIVVFLFLCPVFVAGGRRQLIIRTRDWIGRRHDRMLHDGWTSAKLTVCEIATTAAVFFACMLGYATTTQ